jgi:hypothetical protein
MRALVPPLALTAMAAPELVSMSPEPVLAAVLV